MPAILGFVTLCGDFHLHTVYSDGSMLPDVRVNEIYREGCNALAITDHAEFSPKIPELPKNSNRSNELAGKRAGELSIMFANGTEITRDFPGDPFSAHFVCLFVSDVNAIEKPLGAESPSTVDMLREAKKQGAFIFWAHPWEAEKKVWEENIPELLKEGLLDGVEIMNQGWYSPETLVWGLKNNLAILGNTDAHDPIYYGRPLTLVFAKEKTAESMKEAFFDRRTVVFNGSTLYGKEKFLSAMFYASVTLKYPKITVAGKNPGKLVFVNNSDINFRIIIDKSTLKFDMRKEIIIEANKETTVNVANLSAAAGEHDIMLKFTNVNMYCESGASPGMQLKIKVKVE